MVRSILKLDSLEKRIFSGLSVIILLLAVAYGYFVNGIVFNTVARKGLENNIASMSSDISELEFSYIAAKNSITLPYAYSIGFKDTKDPVFISRASSEHGLSFNTH
jgi:hypothetical protein